VKAVSYIIVCSIGVLCLIVPSDPIQAVEVTTTVETEIVEGAMTT
jgi:hypothetical protein